MVPLLQLFLISGNQVIGALDVLEALAATPMAGASKSLEAAITAVATRPHGDMARWLGAVESLPTGDCTDVTLDSDTLSLTLAGNVDLPALEAALRQLHPWRKGPFEIAGLRIDTEWRSDWKWQRLRPHIDTLAGRRVLDIGCGSGYHAWRMRGAGAELVVGIDPLQLFVMQFHALRRLMLPRMEPVYVLPLGIDDLPAELAGFDTVFSMGVLYHRRSPIDHMLRLRDLTRPGGQVVLETLVVEGDERTVLVPEGRYGRMRNVWMLPSPAALLRWAGRAGYRSARVVDVTSTTTDEQRSTDWMTFESLAESLDPEDPTRTIEGYPAPLRALLVAEV